MCEDCDFDYNLFVKDQEAMDKMYPNPPFDFISSDINRLDEVLVKDSYAIVYHKYTCYCWDNVFPPPEIITINTHSSNFITYRDFYDEIYKSWNVKQMCNHRFLEIIDVKSNVIDLWFGS